MKLWLAAVCATATMCAQTGARVTGRIATQGAPLRGEVIAVSSGRVVQMSRVATDEQGRFAMDLGAGRVVLVAKADGYVSQERQLLVRPGAGETVVQFELAPAGSVSGRVLDESGAGVAGARVWAGYPKETRRWRLSEEAGGEPTDNIGYFRIPVVAQGRPLILHAERDGWLMASSGTLVLRTAEMAGAVLFLSRRGATVRGRVFDDAGNPAAGAEVRLRSLPAAGEFTAEQRASPAFARSTNKVTAAAADGSYVFRGVPAGEAVVTAIAAGRHAAGQASTAAGREAEINLALR